MKKIILLLLILGAGSLLTLNSCSKSAYYKGTVIESADCEWLLDFSGTKYIPVGLRDDLKVNGRVIEVQYSVSAIPQNCGSTSRPVASITRYL